VTEATIDIACAFNQALPDLLVAAATGVLAAVVGSWLALYWNTRQKQREMDLSTAESFHRLYGEFFAVWKLWNYLIRDVGERELPGASRWELLKRATDAEAGVEAILGTLASQRSLEPAVVADLGKFRQAFQSLRETIRDGKPLEWNESSDARYRSFKELATSVAALIHSGRRARSASARKRAATWLEITSNRWEDKWLNHAIQQQHEAAGASRRR
jgi:hypothetical protein